MNYIEIVSTGILALGCIILALLLRDHKATVLQYAAQLVQSAEQAIQGSGMGAAKKALVLAQLEAAGIVSASQGGKPRQVLMDPINLQSLLDN